MIAEVERIKREVGKVYGISTKDIDGPCRSWRISRARMHAMARCRKELPLSFPEIGYYFGRRDHTTIIYAVRIFEKYPSRFSKG